MIVFLSYSYLLGRQILHICSGSGGHKFFLLYVENLPRNLEKFAAKNWSLVIHVDLYNNIQSTDVLI